MSGDIVQWLREYASVVQRDYYDDGDLPKQAADAIEELTVERDASRLIISDLTAEVERLRAAGDRLAEFAGDNPWAHIDIATWQEVRRG